MEGCMENWRSQEFLSVGQISRIFGVGRDAAYQLAHKLPNAKVGNRIRVRTVYLEKYIREQERRRA